MAPERTPLERLLHRWFVEYNPLYLLSATLVLGGTFVASRGLEAESAYGGLVGSLIAEVYSAALIGAAALLHRIGQRRPAVMLALITLLYQGDLTLHTETSANLGAVGAIASLAWLALFGGKLAALGRAMRVRIPRSAFGTAVAGASGLALLPWALPRLEPRAGAALVMLWVFGLAASYRPASVESVVPLDAWGATVLRRTTRAAWAMWSALLVLHAGFWSLQLRLDVGAILPVVPLLLVARLAQTERRTWIVVVTTLALTALVMPASFAAVAFIAGLVLAVRAKSALAAIETTTRERAAAVSPYRVGGRATVERTERVLVPTEGQASFQRLAVGAGSCLYLALATAGWAGGPLPEHVLAYDVVAAVVALVAALRFHVRAALTPLAIGAGHFVVSARLVPAPKGALQWGGAAIALGFALLLASVAVSYRLRPRDISRSDE